mmetsp:Transcript_9300/g.39098  ORF Transcript_9300/g.39098 Transcript_9300/m.39098 type:complete len:288 (+) Transcript_9300:5994-6857(+)
MVMGTSFSAAAHTSGANTSAEKRPATSWPKMLLIAATDGSGTLKTQKCRFRRLGMSFFPPPGVFIAARYWQSTIIFMSPMGFSSEYMPPCSSNCRTISFVTWSPQSFIAGMEMSSTNTSSFFPPGGPNVLPCLFSTLASTVNWNTEGVVRLEKVIERLAITSGSKLLMNCLIVVVFAVPGPPTNSEDFPTLDTNRSTLSRRTESSVGITSDANLGFSCSVGYSHVGTTAVQLAHAPVVGSTKYSNKVSVSGSTKGLGTFDPHSFNSVALNLARSSRGSMPPSDHTTQ